MEAAAPQNIWLQLAAPIVTLSTALVTLAVNSFRDFSWHRLRRVLGEAVVVLGLLGSLTVFLQKASDIWAGMTPEWKTGLAVLGTSFTFLLISYGVDFAREIAELVRQEKARPKHH